MNFGSKFALHDSDDEEEQVRENDPAAGPLSSMSTELAPPIPPLQRALPQEQQQQQRQTGATQPFAQPRSVQFWGSQRDGGLTPPRDPAQPRGRVGLAAAAAPGAAGTALPPNPLKDRAGARLRMGLGAAASGDAEAGSPAPRRPAPRARTWTRKVLLL